LLKEYKKDTSTQKIEELPYIIEFCSISFIYFKSNILLLYIFLNINNL